MKYPLTVFHPWTERERLRTVRLREVRITDLRLSILYIAVLFGEKLSTLDSSYPLIR